ncbi:MAG: hypothetical protein ACK5H1_06035 [Tenacibaculum sp.]
MRILTTILVVCFLLKACTKLKQVKQVSITIKNHKVGAPITLGIPFPKGELYSVDHLRLLTSKGVEIPCQTTEVSTWEPIDNSVKWIWVFFFSEADYNYTLEYGKSVEPMLSQDKIISINNMRSQGGIYVNTGPLSFSIHKKGNGFLDEVFLDSNKNGKFEKEELIASSPDKNRGSFLDLLDDNGIDSSKAIINEVFREKGSGPMHSVFRIEGTYTYNRPDNNLSPFTIWLHAYAGKSYIKVLHTMTYTGIPDKHKQQEGEHANICTQNKKIITENTEDDIGWTQPNDQIAACGLQIKYHLYDDNVNASIPLSEQTWQEDKTHAAVEEVAADAQVSIKILQQGPKKEIINGLDSLYLKEKSNRVSKFNASIFKGEEELTKAQRAKGWLSITDSTRGIAIGIKNFVKEYPKGIEVNPVSKIFLGSIWPKENNPMSFARHNTEPEGGMLGNFAQGITKTTEFIYYFHNNATIDEIDKKMDYVIENPVAHVAPYWYAESKVYGNISPFSSKFLEFENALQYKYQWWAYNQRREPWYGMFNYGDGKNYFINGKWLQWTNNEPAVDFMLWTNFIRTGNPKYYKLAQAMSRHTMDIDNVHWPKKRIYYGELNDAIDFWNYKDEPESTPYLGIGRRHANEHWYALLSAHVWVQGWIASYYISADHRALEVAKMTGDAYINRIWGEHDLRGRRLYLSVLNLVELYDATKLKKYKTELDDRIRLMLEFQQRQGGNLLLDRYGYSQTYVAQGLYKYQQITGDKKTRQALLKHARWVRNVPPLNHEMESYLATIYPLLIGYEFSGEKVYLNQAIKRAKVLKVAKLPKEPETYKNAEAFSNDLLKISNLPNSKKSFTNWQINQGLRVFGWTHAYNIPYLLYWLEKE